MDGRPCPVTDRFGLAGPELLQRLDLPEPWRQSLDASLHLIDELDFQIADLGKGCGAPAPTIATCRG